MIDTTTRPKPTSLFRKIHSMPQHSYYSPLSLLEDAQRTTNLLLSPKFTSPHSKQNHHSGSCLFHDESSQDSGLGDNHSCKDEDFHFVEPVGLPPRSSGKKLSEINEDTCSPIQYSPLKEKRINLLPPTCLFSADEKCTTTSPRPVKGRTPLKMFNLNVSIEEDDGFLEMMDDIDDEDEKSAKEMNAKVSGFSDLIKGPILSSTSFAKSIANRENISPLWRKRIKPRGLFRSPSAPRLNLEQSYEKGRPMSFKRPDPPRDDQTPVMSKRRKSETNLTHTESECEYTPSRLAAKVERCNSDNEHTIKTALTRGVEEPNLIGDFSRAFCLPYVSGRHADLKYITPETYADVADGKYNSIVENFVVVDCRYPYEFKGGHIKGAKNIYSPEDILDEFMKNRKNVSDKNKRLIIIFHCEFSSERGPKLSRHLRKEDRAANTTNYPGLCYPELYLLEGGYKALYQRPNLHRFCEPQGYTPMTHSDFAKELKHFRAKSKSWNGEKSSRLLFKLKC